MIFDILLWLLAHSPICCISDDEIFASLRRESFNCLCENDRSKLRISLIGLMFGTRGYYFATYSFGDSKFKFFHSSQLENFYHEFTDLELTNTYLQNFRKHIEFLSDSDQVIEKEKLDKLVKLEQHRKDTFLQKINISLAVLIGILAVYISKISWHDIHLLSSLYTGVASVAVYAGLNVCLIIWCSIRGNNIYRMRFQDLRNSILKKHEIIAQYYFDWRRIRCEAEVFSHYVQHLQGWIICFIVLLACLSPNFVSHRVETPKNFESDEMTDVIVLNKSDVFEAYTDSSVTWKKILLHIETKQCKEVIVISNSDMSSILTQLEQYTELKVCLFKDQTIGENEFKIIMMTLGEEKE